MNEYERIIKLVEEVKKLPPELVTIILKIIAHTDDLEKVLSIEYVKPDEMRAVAQRLLNAELYELAAAALYKISSLE